MENKEGAFKHTSTLKTSPYGDPESQNGIVLCLVGFSNAIRKAVRVDICGISLISIPTLTAVFVSISFGKDCGLGFCILGIVLVCGQERD